MKKLNKKMKKKKGISPVIATVLLIAMVIVSGLIVFLWFNGIVQEEGVKFGKNLKLNCPDVNFDASYFDGSLKILNRGNVPIYRMKAKVFEEGGYETADVEDWPDEGLNHGQTFSGSIYAPNANKIVLIPVLMGTSGEGKKEYTCEEQYGYEIII